MNVLLINFAYILLTLWLIFTIYYISKAKNNYPSVNPFILDHIPSVFTTLGVFGTFLGIALGLHGFDVGNIDDSIPTLLQGLFVAFWSSIIGIALSLISQVIIHKIQNGQSDDSEIDPREDILSKILKILIEINKSISSDQDGSMTTHLVKMRTALIDSLSPVSENSKKLVEAIGGEGETSLLTQIQNLRVENKEQIDVMKSSRDLIERKFVDLSKVQVEQLELMKSNSKFAKSKLEDLAKIQNEQLDFMKSNTELVESKFDEFTELLKKSNTEALVEVIENVIGKFNERLNELIERLVKENFEELNKSVENLNKWQQANKEQVEALLDQYRTLTEQLTLSATTLNQVSESTEKLVQEDSKLSQIVQELHTITKDGDNVLVQSIQDLSGTSSNFKETSEELKNWFELHSEFTDKIDDLIEKLKEIEALRDRTKGFFNDVKKEFESAATILKQSNENVSSQVNQMREAFTEGMDRSFVALDNILKTMVLEYAKRMNNI